MRILLVEDDDCIAQTLETVLTREKYAIDIAASGEADCQYIGTFTDNSVLLILYCLNLMEVLCVEN